MTRPPAAVGRAPGRDVLVFASAGLMRFVLLVAAMLATGAFVGVTLFGAVAGRWFATAATDCLAAATAPTGSCASGELTYAAAAAVGATLVALAAVVVVGAAPAAVARRRRLRAPGPGFGPAAARVAALSADLGLLRPPALVAGPLGLRDAFCFGLPGRYRIAVPFALAVRARTPGFDAVIAHELAHIRQHDVAFAWLARSVWYALAPLLVAPVVAFAATDDAADLPGYLWRAAGLAAVVQLASRSALRGREHAADLAAAAQTGTAAVVAVLQGTSPHPHEHPRRRAAALLAFHPSRAQRVAVLREPGRAAALTATDGAVVAFLALFTLPVLDLQATAALVAGPSGSAQVAAAVVVGGLAAAVLGPGLWRQAVVRRVTPVADRLAVVLAAVGAAGVAGQLVSPAGVGWDTPAGVAHPPVVLVTAGAMVGATAVVAGLAEVLADGCTGGGRTRSVLGGVVTPAAVLTAGLWAGDVLQGLLDAGGWAAAGSAVFAMLTSVPVACVAVALGGVVAGGLLARRPGPDVASPGPCLGHVGGHVSGHVGGHVAFGHVVRAAVGAAVGAGAVLLGHRAAVGESSGAAETLNRYFADLWMAAAAAAAACVALAVRFGTRGRGAGLAAGPLAALLVAAVHVALLVGLNGSLPSVVAVAVAVATDIATRDLALGFLLTVATAAVPLPGRRPVASTRSPRGLVVAAAASACAACLAVALTRGVLIPSALTVAP